VIPPVGPPLRLDGRVAVVTGASSGIGAYAAELLAAAGADVVVGARRLDRLDAVAARVRAAGRHCVAVRADVASAADCTALCTRARDELGRLDVLVAAAGTGHAARAEHDDPARVEALLAVNLAGAHHSAAAAARVMVETGTGGSIVLVSSATALSSSGLPQAAYTASKAGLLGLARDLALQWSGRHGIRVNALAPGFVATEMTAPLLGTDAGRARIAARTPLGRPGRLDELAGPLLLLASDAGSYITGAALAVDGGWSAGSP
jgi:NAD(P)-dependent dehydrogenase (short-subunit alcohol dehydrogenase family)